MHGEGQSWPSIKEGGYEFINWKAYGVELSGESFMLIWKISHELGNGIDFPRIPLAKRVCDEEFENVEVGTKNSLEMKKSLVLCHKEVLILLCHTTRLSRPVSENKEHNKIEGGLREKSRIWVKHQVQNKVGYLAGHYSEIFIVLF